jgi:transposase
MVSAYRNSRTCPLHKEELSFTNGYKLGQCPRGHWIHRDVASPLNMLKKAVEEKRVRDKVAEAIREALNAVTIEELEEWSKMLVEHELMPRCANPGPAPWPYWARTR